MKSFVITLVGNPEFEKYGHVANGSALKFGYDSQIFNAYTGPTGSKYISDNGLRAIHNESPLYDHSLVKSGMAGWLNRPGTIGCFVSHYALWNKCIELDETIVVLEHDALITNEWPEPEFEDVLYLKHTGSIRHAHSIVSNILTIAPVQTGVYEMKFSTVGNPMWTTYLMSTTFGYAITPVGAQKMIDKTKVGGWYAVDKLMASDAIRIDTINPSLADEQPDSTYISTTNPRK